LERRNLLISDIYCTHEANLNLPLKFALHCQGQSESWQDANAGKSWQDANADKSWRDANAGKAEDSVTGLQPGSASTSSATLQPNY
jgi:hypothetical protein